jgi:glucose-6-phosphate isomerase
LELLQPQHCWYVCVDVAVSKFYELFIFIDFSYLHCLYLREIIKPLAIVFGWSMVEQFLAGAHDMDKHFVETNPRHNFPVLLALTDVWNDAFLGSSGRIVTPFSEQFASYASFVAILESETCGRCFDKQGRKVSGSKTASAAVIQGSLQGEYDRMLYQGGRIFPSELIATMQSPAATVVELGSSGAGSRITAHDRMMCTLFAHADLLAFGSIGPPASVGDNPIANRQSLNSYQSSGAIPPNTSSAVLQSSSTESQSQSEGNRPSTLMLCSRCDAFTCGQLVALSEHRVVVAARIWDVNPFLSESGSRLRETETERLQEKLQNLWVMGIDETDDDDKLDYVGEKSNFATSKVLAHYANSRAIS